MWIPELPHFGDHTIMTTVYLDRSIADDQRRAKLNQHGHLFAYSPNPHSLALMNLARELLSDAWRRNAPPRLR